MTGMPPHSVHAEAARLLARGFRLCTLHSLSKQPVGDDWQQCPVTSIDGNAGGYGLMLAANGLCSIDPDNVDKARQGLRNCGFDLDAIMEAGIRTTSTRPGSGGRATFRAPADSQLRWISFRSKAAGVLLELRATSSNLQDCLPGTVYMTAAGGPFEQQYAGPRRLDEAPPLPQPFMDWWLRLSTDHEYLVQQQRLFCGEDAALAVSGAGALGFPSDRRMDFNAANPVDNILKRHGYQLCNRGRWAPPNATGAPGIRPIPGKAGLWQSDHASDLLHGTFDAWSAYVVLDHGGSVQAAEAAWAPRHSEWLVEGFQEISVAEGDRELPPFKRDRSGDILARKENLVRALVRPDLSGSQLRYDTFRGEMMTARADTEEWRPFKDTDYTELCLKLERLGFKNIGKELIRDCVAYVADNQRFDSGRHWLESLSWDGVARVQGFLARYFGGADTAYTRAVGAYLWTALAGRVMEPAVKCDMVPVLVGAQGMRKSSAVAAIVPADEFFTTIDLGRKDDELARLMRGKLVVELDELKGLSTREAEHIKAFITRRHEEWTPKYLEMNTRYPRRCVFVGTSNKDDFLADETGNRRWLPLRCGMCDPDGIAKDREQLWAEARELFLASGVLHAEAECLAAKEHEQFMDYDEWLPVVMDWLRSPSPFGGETPASRPYLTAREVLKDALGISDTQQTPQHQRRIKKILLQLEYTYSNKRVGGARMRVYEPRTLF